MALRELAVYLLKALRKGFFIVLGFVLTKRNYGLKLECRYDGTDAKTH